MFLSVYSLFFSFGTGGSLSSTGFQNLHGNRRINKTNCRNVYPSTPLRVGLNRQKGGDQLNYQEQIVSYKPFNQKEKQDKEMMLNLMDTYSSLLTRENEKAHFTASAWVVNETFTKTVMAYHNIYQSWSWLGGHADGESDLLQVALREVSEETGLHNIEAVILDIFSLEILDVPAHVKNNKEILAHLHLNVTYLIVADETEELRVKPDENSAVAWMGLEEAVESSREPFMKTIYEKLNQKVLDLKKN